MMSILDRLAKPQPVTSFRPQNVRDLFLLRLAQKLGEPLATDHYRQLAGDHTDESLLLAYRRGIRRRSTDGNLAKSFHIELAGIKEQYTRSPIIRLLAIKVERRSVAIAVFVGTRLDFHDVRELSSKAEKAEASAAGFVSWALANFEIESATVERMANGAEIRRSILNKTILNLLRAGSIPIWEVAKREVLEAYSHPPLQSRADLRQVAQSILWSMFTTDKPHSQEVDAAALGLYVQTERLFL